jgi:O-acetyl-ADP-ribose deacetylase (regulator of RNase III)
MIHFVRGNLFQSAAQVLTNTVNCVGVMGKGVALEFKGRFPAMFEDYRSRCEKGEVRPGRPYLWEDDRAQILNFPTKRDWRNPSLLSDIEDGLRYLAAHYQELGIHSLAMPALGCGNGGLKWDVVRPLIEKHLGPISDLDVYVYEPDSAGVERISSDGTKAKVKGASDFAAAQPTLIP